jgi:hypothetical protein
VQEKKVKRLSIVFDDENEVHGILLFKNIILCAVHIIIIIMYQVNFRDRVDKCKALKDECIAIRRYTSYVESQPANLFLPIQQSALHGIVAKLLRNCHDVCVHVHFDSSFRYCI